MVSITLTIDDVIRSKMEHFPWINWSEIAREEILKKENILLLLEKLKSKEEQEFIKWSVELGRKAKKGRFKRLLTELSSKEREELLSELSPKQKAKLEL